MINIIGAGPVGCYAAYRLAKQGKEVSIFEDNLVVGKPVQCTGVLSFEIKKILELKKEFIVNRIKNIEAIAPDGNSVKIKLKQEETIINRTKFDQYLCKKALDEGAQLFLGHKFLDYENNNIIISSKKRIKKIKTNILIGADGANSQVAKSAGLFGKRGFLIGTQARVNMKTDKTTYKTFFGSVCPGLFAWIVPESESIARVGLASMKNPALYFDRFIKKLDCSVIEKQGGLIPLYNPKQKTAKDNIYLVGDAATQAKATTAGGIVQGLEAADILADSILYNKDYEKEWRKKLGRELWIHLKIRKILNRFSDKDYNELIKLMKQKKVLDVLQTESRDAASGMLLKLVMREPRFLKYGFKVF